MANLNPERIVALQSEPCPDGVRPDVWGKMKVGQRARYFDAPDATAKAYVIKHAPAEWSADEAKKKARETPGAAVRERGERATVALRQIAADLAKDPAMAKIAGDLEGAADLATQTLRDVPDGWKVPADPAKKAPKAPADPVAAIRALLAGLTPEQIASLGFGGPA